MKSALVTAQQGQSQWSSATAFREDSMPPVPCVCMLSCVSLCPFCRLLPARLLCPRTFSSKKIGAGCHFLLQRIFLTQGLNPCLLHLLHRQADSLPLCNLGSPKTTEIFLETGNSETPFSQSSGFQPRLYWFGQKVNFPQVFPSIRCYKPLSQPDTTFCWTLWKLAGVFLFLSLKCS